VETLVEKPNRVIFSGKPAKLTPESGNSKKLQATAGQKTLSGAMLAAKELLLVG